MEQWLWVEIDFLKPYKEKPSEREKEAVGAEAFPTFSTATSNEFASDSRGLRGCFKRSGREHPSLGWKNGLVNSKPLTWLDTLRVGPPSDMINFVRKSCPDGCEDVESPQITDSTLSSPSHGRYRFLAYGYGGVTPRYSLRPHTSSFLVTV